MRAGGYPSAKRSLESTVTPGSAGEVLRSTGAAWASAEPQVSDLKSAGGTLANLNAALSDIASIVGLATAPSAAGEMAVFDGSGWKSTSRASDIETTTTVGAVLGANTQPATVAKPVQRSRAVIVGQGAGWDTDDTVSVTEEWAIEVRPTSAASVTSTLNFLRRNNGGAWGQLGLTMGISGVAMKGTTVFTGGMEQRAWTISGIGGVALRQSGAATPLLLNTGLVDAADAVAWATNYDRGAASITNAATIRIHSFGWTDNTDTYTELAAVFADGHAVFAGPVHVPSYTVAGKPAAGTAGRIAFCSDETGGATLMFDDGTNWKRVSDLATVS